MGLSVNNVVNFKGVEKSDTNLLDKFRVTPQIQAQDSDKIILDRDFIADLKSNPKMSSFGTIVEGYINRKPATLKIVSGDNGEGWLEGAINKEYIYLHSVGKSYDGKYGDSEFNFVIDYNEPSKFSKFIYKTLLGKTFKPDYFLIQGTIDGKELSLKFPNAAIPNDPKIRNLITLILEDNGLKAQTIKGEIKSLKFSSSAIKNIKKRSEKREKVINDNIKPIFMQCISSATGLIVGSIISTMLIKFGLRR